MAIAPAARCGNLAAALIGAALAAGMIAPAAAQDDTDTRGATVTSRERQRVEDASIHTGGLIITPQMLASATYDDNVFATNTNHLDDVYFTVRPQVAVRSDWTRHEVQATAYFEHEFYAKYTDEDVSTYGGALSGRYDISHQTRFYAGVGYDRSVEKRGSLSSFFFTTEPVQYDILTATAALEHEFGDITLRADGRVRRFTYGDARINGADINQKFRNFTVWSGSLQGSYTLNDLTKFVLRGTYESRVYDLRPGDAGFDPITQIDRTGDSVLLEGGVEREINSLIYATVRVGYLNFRYPDPRVRDVDDFSYYANLRWNVTPLTTINGTAQRRVDETVSTVSAGNLRDEISLAVDHELLRQLIIGGHVRFAWINPSIDPSVPLAVSTKSKEQEAGIDARYYIGRRILLSADYTYNARQSDNRQIAYKSNNVTLGLSFIF